MSLSTLKGKSKNTLTLKKKVLLEVSLLKVMQLRISGTLTRQGVYGEPFQIVVLPKKELHVMVVRNRKKE